MTIEASNTQFNPMDYEGQPPLSEIEVPTTSGAVVPSIEMVGAEEAANIAWYGGDTSLAEIAEQLEDLPASTDLDSVPGTLSQESASKDTSWYKRNKSRLFLGAAAAGVAGTVTGIANGSFDNVEHAVVAEAPWVIAGAVASETLFIGGLAGMAAGLGKEVGNPLTLRGRFNEVMADAADNRIFKVGLAANTLGALGTAGVVAAGAVEVLPAETWPGALSIAALDVASTVALRAGVYKSMQASGEKAATAEKSPRIKSRLARPEDIDRLADIDLELFDKAYGEEKPSKEKVVEMLTARLKNGGQWMFVTELDGQVEGFVSAFRTSTSLDDFESWEKSTSDGTLDGKVDPNGNYMYVTNMTIRPNASKAGAKEMLLGNLFAYAIEEGIEYGYFESRMPSFKRWLDKQGGDSGSVNYDDDSLQHVAEEYMDMRRKDGSRRDPMLRMYEGMGFELARVVPNAFNDDASLNFGVICKAEVPLSNMNAVGSKIYRKLYATALRQVAKSPKLIQKVL